MAFSFQERVDGLFREYLADAGCPCRFPRLRAVVQRDTSRSLGFPCKTDDQVLLIAAFERNTPLGDRAALGGLTAPVEGMWQASCQRCSSRVERSSNELTPGGWVDFLVIRKAPDAVDLGAPVESGKVLRCRPFIALGSGSPNLRRAAEVYPLVDDDAWFTWLRTRIG